MTVGDIEQNNSQKLICERSHFPNSFKLLCFNLILDLSHNVSFGNTEVSVPAKTAHSSAFMSVYESTQIVYIVMCVIDKG